VREKSERHIVWGPDSPNHGRTWPFANEIIGKGLVQPVPETKKKNTYDGRGIKLAP
jgi:hypothetical protein